VRPYLSLNKENKAIISETIFGYSRTEDVFLAVRSALEEFGSDLSAFVKLLRFLEDRGDLNVGLWDVIEGYFKGNIGDQDVDRIPRAIDRY